MRALVTGINGQDGSYLAESLLAAGHEVHGVVRTGPGPNLAGLSDALRTRLTLHTTPLHEAAAVHALIDEVHPDRCFHLAATSFIGKDQPDGMAFNVSSTLALLEAMHQRAPRARFLHAGSAAQLAGAAKAPQDEDTPAAPTTWYGLSKHLSAEAVRFYRERHGMHACTAILYNHESPRRPVHFLSRKVARAAARVAAGLERSVELGNLDSVRDWGWAPDTVLGMEKILAHDTPSDWVLATGHGRTVREMAETAFAAVGLRLDDHLVVDPSLLRPPDPVPLIGDARRAREVLGWQPRTPFAGIMQAMVDAEVQAARR